jgi:hypothetical protein
VAPLHCTALHCTAPDRFNIHHDSHHTWTLQVRDVQAEDRGYYMCQVGGTACAEGSNSYALLHYGICFACPQ